MQIGELASRSAVSTRTLRYYEEQGLLTPSRDANGYRRYSVADVLTVRQVRAFLRAGLSTSTIAELLPCARGEEPLIDHCPRTVALMRKAMTQVEQDLERLRVSQARLASYLPEPQRRVC